MVLRGLAVLVSAAVLVPWLWDVSADAGHAAVRGVPLRPDEWLTAIVASAALAGVGWLTVSVLLELLSLVPGAVGRGADRVAEVVTPRLVRRAAGALLGVGLVAGLAPGASVAAPSAAATVVRGASGPLPDPGFAPLPEPRAWRRCPTPGFAPAARPGFARAHPAGTRQEPTDRGPGWVPGPPSSGAPRRPGAQPGTAPGRDRRCPAGRASRRLAVDDRGPPPRARRVRRERSRGAWRPGSRPTAASSVTTPTWCVRARSSARPRGCGLAQRRSAARHTAEPGRRRRRSRWRRPSAVPARPRPSARAARRTSRTPWPSTSRPPPTSSSSARNAPCATTCPTPRRGRGGSPWPCSR